MRKEHPQKTVDLGNNLPRLEEALFKERNLIKFLMYLNRT